MRYRFSKQHHCWQHLVHVTPLGWIDPYEEVWHAVGGDSERELDRITLLRPAAAPQDGRRLLRAAKGSGTAADELLRAEKHPARRKLI